MALLFRINVISKSLNRLCGSFTHPFFRPLSYPQRSLFTSVRFAKKKVDEGNKIPSCPDFEQYFTKTKKGEGNKNDKEQLGKRSDEKQKPAIQPPIFGDKPKATLVQQNVIAEKKNSSVPTIKKENGGSFFPVKVPNAKKSPAPHDKTKPPQKPQTFNKKSSLTMSLQEFAQNKLTQRSSDTKNVLNESRSSESNESNLSSSQSRTTNDVASAKGKRSEPKATFTVDGKTNKTSVWLAAVATAVCALGLTALLMKRSSSDHLKNLTQNEVVIKTEGEDVATIKTEKEHVPKLQVNDQETTKHDQIIKTEKESVQDHPIVKTEKKIAQHQQVSRTENESVQRRPESKLDKEVVQPHVVIKAEKYAGEQVIKTEKDVTQLHSATKREKEVVQPHKREKKNFNFPSSIETEQIDDITPSDIPKKVPYLIIGGGTASWSAFRAIKEHVPDAKVLVVSNEHDPPYMRPALAQNLMSTEQINEELYFEPTDFFTDTMQLFNGTKGGIAILRNKKAKYLKLCERKVVLSDGTEIEYDECLVAIGSQPRNLHLFQTAPARVRKKISFFRSLNDVHSIKEIAAKSESIAVIGGGFLASQISLALTTYAAETEALKVYQIFHENGNMGMTLPRYFSDWIKRKLTKHGLFVIPSTQVDSVHMENSKLKLALLTGELVVVDHVIVALGSEPDYAFAQQSGLKLASEYRGIAVNEHLEALPHLYVAGDAGGHFGKETDTNYDHAVASGRLAGQNMVGEKKPYVHQSMFSTVVAPEFAFESVGLIDSKLKTIGVFSDGTNLTPNIENTDRGVVFYMKYDRVVGILLWNVSNKINVARQVIAEGKKVYDINEVLKRFEIQQ